MSDQSNDALAKEHLRQAWAAADGVGGWREQHLTAALVYAVLAVNDTLDWIAKMIHQEGAR